MGKFVVGKKNAESATWHLRKLLYLDVHTYGLCLKHLFPEEIKWCQVFDVQSELQPKASVPFKFPLVCQLPAVSWDRGLSEAIATDFLFEAIQLVTCEISVELSTRLFFPQTPSNLFYFSQAKFGQKTIEFKQPPRKNYHLAPLHRVTHLWEAGLFKMTTNALCPSSAETT